MSKRSFPWSLHAVSHQCLKPAGLLELVQYCRCLKPLAYGLNTTVVGFATDTVLSYKLEIKCLSINSPHPGVIFICPPKNQRFSLLQFVLKHKWGDKVWQVSVLSTLSIWEDSLENCYLGATSICEVDDKLWFPLFRDH